MISLENLRRDYSEEPLRKGEVDPDPIKQFEGWFEAALDSDLTEPNAMTLATVDEVGRPSARIVLLKEVDSAGFVFYTNYNSRKGLQMEANGHVALVFAWLELHRQIRIEGRVEKVDEALSTRYFQLRPRGSQLGAWASAQSKVISSRQALEDNMEELERKFAGVELLDRPPHWGGYRVIPHRLEFWQGRPSRLHDRIQYRLEAGDKWVIERLAP